jgi:hypothetical protein
MAITCFAVFPVVVLSVSMYATLPQDVYTGTMFLLKPALAVNKNAETKNNFFIDFKFKMLVK